MLSPYLFGQKVKEAIPFLLDPNGILLSKPGIDSLLSKRK